MLLPADGRKGKTPKWPLPTPAKAPEELLALEAELWATHWRLPQAVAWERIGCHHEVALFCRHMAAAEFGSIDAAKEARMRSDRLGLTPASMG
mgnify:CR=1 FL=1